MLLKLTQKILPVYPMWVLKKFYTCLLDILFYYKSAKTPCKNQWLGNASKVVNH
jgi:hypothetical protein